MERFDSWESTYFPHPRLSPHAKTLRNEASGPKIPVVVGDTKEPGGVRTFHVFKSLLAAHSSYFEAATSSRWMRSPKDIKLEDEDPKIFEMFLQWMCTGEFNYMIHCLRDEEEFKEPNQTRDFSRTCVADEVTHLSHLQQTDIKKIPHLSLPVLSLRCYYFGYLDRKEQPDLTYDDQKRFITNIEVKTEQVAKKFLGPSDRSAFITEDRKLTGLKWRCKEFSSMAGEQYLKCTIIDPGLALTTIIHLYILADKFNVSELRDRVIEELLDMEWKRFMDWEHIELVYGNTMPGSMMLRKLAVKSIQQYGRINELEKPSSFSSALGEFFFDFAKYRDQTAGSTQGSTADIEHDNRCAWHEHGDEKKEGAFCPTRGPR